MACRGVCGIILTGFLCSAQAEDGIEAMVKTCYSCHGANGVSVTPATPSIGGQPEAYIRKALLEWKAGVRHSATMGGLAKGYSDEQVSALAAYLSRQPWTPASQNLDANLVNAGKVVSERCAGCHGDTGAASDGEMPNLNGQWAHYLEQELHEYRDDSEPLPNKKMRNVAKKLSEEEIKAVAAFFASQGK